MEEEVHGMVTQTKGESGGANKSWLNYIKAGFLLLLGTTITILLGNPLIETVEEFSASANISSFNVLYVVIPLALNYRQAVAAITAARQKTRRAISLTLSEIYGAVFMNNMMGLLVLLAVVYIRDLSWDASAEVVVVLIICTVAGIFASACTKFPVWTSLLACLLYPISLLLLYVLTTVFGWA
ncbi:hypothetical protein U1Q18_010542 [Sarracenia purpurea var. burkii]